jgi:hypothetical protein
VFEPGQQVLVLLPVPGQPLSVMYHGPYVVTKLTSEVDYLIYMPVSARPQYQECYKSNIKCVPNNMEKYISFTIDNLKFIDSFQFLSAGLDKLAAILKSDEFEHTRLHIPVDKVHLMIRKGTFCYDYWDGPEKALESRLPPRDAFFSQLKQEAMNEEDYQHAQNVWTAFELESLGQYHDLYLKTDTLIFADVFERFRTSSIKLYRLDPCHYLSTPGLSWETVFAMLNDLPPII